MITVDTLMTGLRPLLGDSVAPYRWTDTTAGNPIYGTLELALLELFSKRPSAFNLTSIVTAFPALPANPGDTVPVKDSYKMALCYFMAALTMLGDSDDSFNSQQAQMNFDLWVRELGGS